MVSIAWPSESSRQLALEKMPAIPHILRYLSRRADVIVTTLRAEHAGRTLAVPVGDGQPAALSGDAAPLHRWRSTRDPHLPELQVDRSVIADQVRSENVDGVQVRERHEERRDGEAQERDG